MTNIPNKPKAVAKRSPNLKDNPFTDNELQHAASDELQAVLLFIRHQWYYLVLGILAIGLLIVYLKPLPPSNIRMARGQANSSIEIEAINFKNALEEHGIEVELIDSKGTLDSFKKLENNEVDVALSQSGLPMSTNKNIVSLGSIGYQALWFFYTGPEIKDDDFFKHLKNKKIYTNRVGSGTYYMVQSLLNASLQPFAIEQIQDMSPKQAVEALKARRIDGLFLLAGYDSQNVQALLADSKIHPYSFPIAQALSAKIKGVDVVTAPQGIYAISPLHPPQDIKMIAVATTLLAHKDLHPEIQYLLLETAKANYDKNEVVFDRPGGFPAFTEKGLPHSKIADKFYTKGPPLLSGELPHWLSSFLDKAWFSLIAIAAIIIPLMQFRPNYRLAIFNKYSKAVYKEIFALTADIHEATSTAQLPEIMEKINALTIKVKKLWVPEGSDHAYASMLNAMAILIADLKNKESDLQLKPVV